MSFCGECGSEMKGPFCGTCGNSSENRVLGDSVRQTPTASLETKAFLKSLFDFKFESFITPKIIRVFYIIVTLAYGLLAVAIVFSAFASGRRGAGALALFLVPIGYLFYLGFVRIGFEIIFLLFQIGADIRTIASKITEEAQ